MDAEAVPRKQSATEPDPPDELSQVEGVEVGGAATPQQEVRGHVGRL